MRRHDMTRDQAVKMDKGNRYVDYDEETACWGIFGTESGFCYGLYAGEPEANDKLGKDAKESRPS